VLRVIFCRPSVAKNGFDFFENSNIQISPRHYFSGNLKFDFFGVVVVVDVFGMQEQHHGRSSRWRRVKTEQ
jgi:hypothetical protein